MVWSECVRVIRVLVCAWIVRMASGDSESVVTWELGALLSPEQTHVSVTGWAPRGSPAPLARCAALQDLSLHTARVSELPARWVAACPRLQTVWILGAANLTHLPHELLANTPELTEFSLFDGSLEELPSDLFDYSPKLNSVDLLGNSLVTLPSGIFTNCVALRSLDLSRNKLQASALQALTAPALRGLAKLDLGRNPIQDLCDSSQDDSTLSSLRNLEYLSLSSTKITTICRDWRILMPRLRDLRLVYTRISRLQRSDLEFVREINSSVWLYGAPLTSVQLNESDYWSEPTSASVGTVTVELSSNTELQCSCGMYWTWRALRDGRWPARVLVQPLRCAGEGRELRELEEHELMCDDERTCSALPAGCACRWRPAGGSRHLRVSCAGAGLSAVPPQLRDIVGSVDLLLARNNISTLHLERLPPNFTSLDLSHNNLRELDAATATELIRDGRRVKLSGNPWSCACGFRPALAALRAAAGAVPDLPQAACADGRRLASVPTEPCESPAPAAQL